MGESAARQGETCTREVDICQTAGCEVQGVAACHLVNKQQLLEEDGGGVIHTRAPEHGRWMYFFICVNSRSQLLAYLRADGKV